MHVIALLALGGILIWAVGKGSSDDYQGRKLTPDEHKREQAMTRIAAFLASIKPGMTITRAQTGEYVTLAVLHNISLPAKLLKMVQKLKVQNPTKWKD